jgi:hypothetical protein
MQVRLSVFSELPVLYTTAGLSFFVPIVAYPRQLTISVPISLHWPSAHIFDAVLPSLVLEPAVRSRPYAS